jgi:hypothetical protein
LSRRRPQGSLRILTLDFCPTGDLPLSALPVALFVKQCFREITLHGGARELTTLQLDLKPYSQGGDDAETPFQIIVAAALFAEFSAVGLRTLRILSNLDRFPSGAPFFFALPGLQKLVLSSDRFEPSPDSRLPDFFQCVAPPFLFRSLDQHRLTLSSLSRTVASITSTQVASVALRTLVLSGTSLMDGNYVSFPNLSIIKLLCVSFLLSSSALKTNFAVSRRQPYSFLPVLLSHSNVKCSNLLGLLSACASTLEVLWLRRVTSDPSNRFLPPAPAGGTKDLPGVLECVFLVFILSWI